MRIENVEIYSDQTNAAVLRHPSRTFPGVLVQGDTLYSMCYKADQACKEAGRSSPIYKDLNELRNTLRSFLTHYKAVLAEHEIQPPFSEQSHF